MSDSNSPGTPDSGQPSNPYGDPPASPHGQPDPYGQPPQQPGHGQQPPPYGQPAPYGQQQPAYDTSGGYGAPPAYSSDPHKRPGTVTAAGIITIICAGLSFLLMALFALMLAVAKDEAREQIEKEPAFEDAGISADTLIDAGVAIFGILALWCLIATVLGFLVLRRSNGARIALVVSAAVSALVSLLGITGGVTAITLIASIAVIVLLFTGGASEWFKGKNAAPATY